MNKLTMHLLDYIKKVSSEILKRGFSEPSGYRKILFEGKVPHCWYCSEPLVEGIHEEAGLLENCNKQCAHCVVNTLNSILMISEETAPSDKAYISPKNLTRFIWNGDYCLITELHLRNRFDQETGYMVPHSYVVEFQSPSYSDRRYLAIKEGEGETKIIKVRYISEYGDEDK